MTNSEKFDFLYVDYDRVCSYLASLGGLGSVALIKENKAQEKSSTDTGQADFYVVNAKRDLYESTSENKTTVYDVKWNNIFLFLNEFNKNFSQSKLDNIADNDMVRLSGKLFLRDSSLISNFAENYVSAYDKLLVSAGIEEYSYGLEEQFYDQVLLVNIENNKKIALDRAIDKSISVVSGILQDEHGLDYWFAIDNKKYLYQTTESLMLKYATSLGTWNIICVVDDTNTEVVESFQYPFSTNEHSRIYETIYKRVGRPKDHVCITPLVIYRTINDSKQKLN